MSDAADRGKVAEGKLKKAFDKLDLSLPRFTYERIYDARSSRGAMANPRAGDFVLYHEGRNILLEVKEVAHDFRLPCANFKLDQRARLRKRMLAGSICGIIVYHSTTDKWRLLTLPYFGLQDKGSWDLSKEPELSLADILTTLTTKHILLC